MKTTDEMPSARGTVIALFLSAVGVLCVFAAIMVTIHAMEKEGRLNQALSLTLRWFEQISETGDSVPAKEQFELRSIRMWGPGID